MNSMARALRALGFALAAVFARPVYAAQDSARIVVVTDHADSAIIPLLRAELTQLGLEVIEVENGAHEVIAHELTETARQYHAVAAFRVLVSSHTVEVWIADRVTGNVSLREVFTQSADSNIEVRLVVLQAVELLRWCLKEVEPFHPSRGDVQQPPPTLAAYAGTQKDDSQALGIAPLALFSLGGATPGAGAQLDMTVRWSWVGTRLGYGQLVFPANFETSAGRAELVSRWFAIQIVGFGRTWARRITPRIAMGVAMVSTSLHGIANPPRVATDDNLFSVAPILDGRLGYKVAPHVQLTLSFSVMLPLRSDTVVFEGQTAGTYGTLLVAPAIGIEAGIP